jgi:DNA-binding MarR family transcriptional regulator
MDVTKRYITKIARAALRYANYSISKMGVGSSEFECLHVIRKNEGTNQELICEKLNIDKSAVTRMISNLEKKGYVIRKKDESNKRFNKIYSTEKALEVKLDETSAESLFYEWLTSDIPEEELAQFLKTLDKLYIKSKNERVVNYSNFKEWKENTNI